MEHLIYDIFTGDKSHMMFEDLSAINDQLVRARAYHSQMVGELYITLQAQEDTGHKYGCGKMIKELLDHSIYFQRIAEFKLSSFQLSTCQVILSPDHEKCYQLYFVIYDLKKKFSHVPGKLSARSVSRTFLTVHIPLELESLTKLMDQNKTNITENILKRAQLVVTNLNKTLIVNQ